MEDEEIIVKVKCLQRTLLLCLICVAIASVQSRAYAHVAVAYTRTTQQEESLPPQLTATLMDQQYCIGDAELDSLQMKVRLTFTNIGTRQLILYKGSDLISRIAISRNVEDAAAKQFEVNASITEITDGKRMDFHGSVPGSAFVVLSPGTSYEVETVVTVFAVRGNAREIAGAVRSGKHVLQVEVSTWPHSKALAEELRRRWQFSGFLWSDPLISVPMPFTVKTQRNVVDCP